MQEIRKQCASFWGPQVLTSASAPDVSSPFKYFRLVNLVSQPRSRYLNYWPLQGSVSDICALSQFLESNHNEDPIHRSLTPVIQKY
jgi:hypothetical protein